MINIEKLKQVILKETEITSLYEIQIDLSKLIKNAHKQNLIAETALEKSEAKGNLGIYHSMLEVLQNRISKLKEIDKEERNEDNRINYNFRLAAKTVLKKETYNQIMNLALIKRAEFKEKAEILKQQKIA